jgi:phenylalanyl-tRNA synthetase beta subunit
MRIIPAWLREFVDIAVDDRQLAEDLTSAGIAVESVQEENGATVYEMDLTTNRVDAMNHYGVAREASAIYNIELKKIEPKLSAINRGPSTSLGMTHLESTSSCFSRCVGRYPSNFFASSSLTSVGLAWPLDAFITCPTK